jgi:hypothetical protein
VTPDPRPNLWPALVASLEAMLTPAATMDVRQHAAARQIRERVLDMVRTRATEAGPVREVSSTAAIDGVMDALLALWAVERAAPERYRPVIRQLVAAQLQVLVGLAGVSRPVQGGES